MDLFQEMDSPRGRAIDGFLDRATDEWIKGQFEEAERLVRAAEEFGNMSDRDFEKKYMEAVD